MKKDIKKRKSMSSETKEKIRISNTGKKHSDETRKKMSLSHKGFKHTKKSIDKMSGKNSPQWKGGITININKYINDRYNNATEEKKKKISWSNNKRNRLKSATIKELGSHTYGDWEILKKQYGNTCPCCKKSEPEIKLTEDHIIPLSKGGSDLIENIQPLCLSCNVKKHTRIIKF